MAEIKRRKLLFNNEHFSVDKLIDPEAIIISSKGNEVVINDISSKRFKILSQNNSIFITSSKVGNEGNIDLVVNNDKNNNFVFDQKFIIQQDGEPIGEGKNINVINLKASDFEVRLDPNNSKRILLEISSTIMEQIELINVIELQINELQEKIKKLEATAKQSEKFIGNWELTSEITGYKSIADAILDIDDKIGEGNVEEWRKKYSAEDYLNPFSAGNKIWKSFLSEKNFYFTTISRVYARFQYDDNEKYYKDVEVPLIFSKEGGITRGTNSKFEGATYNVLNKDPNDRSYLTIAPESKWKLVAIRMIGDPTLENIDISIWKDEIDLREDLTSTDPNLTYKGISEFVGSDNEVQNYENLKSIVRRAVSDWCNAKMGLRAFDQGNFEIELIPKESLIHYDVITPLSKITNRTDYKIVVKAVKGAVGQVYPLAKFLIPIQPVDLSDPLLNFKEITKRWFLDDAEASNYDTMIKGIKDQAITRVEIFINVKGFEYKGSNGENDPVLLKNKLNEFLLFESIGPNAMPKKEEVQNDSNVDTKILKRKVDVIGKKTTRFKGKTSSQINDENIAELLEKQKARKERQQRELIERIREIEQGS